MPYEVEVANAGAKGIWKYGYEALRLVKWLQSDKYYDNINYFDLLYTIMKKEKNIIITKEGFEIINGHAQ